MSRQPHCSLGQRGYCGAGVLDFRRAAALTSREMSLIISFSMLVFFA